MIRYMPIITIGGETFDTKLRDELNSPVWCLSKKIPDCQYIKVEIQISEKEKRYIDQRKSKKRRWLFWRREEK